MHEMPAVPTASLTFIGNATTVLRLGDFTLMTDPNFVPAGVRVHLGHGVRTRRLLDPAMHLADLPALDGVLLSHLHEDHFDQVARAELPLRTPIFTTPQARRRLRQWRFRAVRDLHTWETYDWSRGRQRLRLTAVPGRHGPGLAGRLLPDVMGTVVELMIDEVCRLRLYVTGDTLYGPFLEEISRRCGDMDAMLIHLGGARVLGVLVSMDDRQGVALTELIRPRLTIPVHFDDYAVCKSPLSDFLQRAREHGLAGVRPITRGDKLNLPLRPPASELDRPSAPSRAEISSTSAAPPEQPAHDLREGLIALAGTPDDESSVPALLRSITQFCADLLPPVDYASVTIHRAGAYSTVAMSSEIALAVDEAQYADDSGPCLDSIRTGTPVSAPEIDATVPWPRFREAALRLGLRASLSLPLFAGRGTPIAALNLYGHDKAAMAPLSAAILDLYDRPPEGGDTSHLDSLGPGAHQLLDGLEGALAVRATIQRAIGVIIAQDTTNADLAYTILRSRAAETASSLAATAESVLTRTGGEQRPA